MSDHDEHVDPSVFVPSLLTVVPAAIIAILLVMFLVELPTIAG